MGSQLGACLLFGSSVLTWMQENKRPVGTTIAVTGFTVGIIRFCKGYYYKSRLRQKRQAKQKASKEAIEALRHRVELTGMSESEMESICTLTLNQLARKLQSGEISASDTLHAYQKKALQVNTKTNALIDVICEAEAMAMECDQVINTSARLLHGIPISVKDNFTMQGYDSVIGLSCNIDKPYSKDCVVIKVLKHQGAVPFVRTNVPQTMLAFDTTNPVYGQTKNPYGQGRSAGGSSGGEAALIAGGGSPLGVGSDIGGSIRIPASFCGVCGFKPTSGRISSKDTNSIFKGQNMVVASYGPLARDVDSIVLLMRALLCQYHFDLDKTVPPLPFNEEVFARKEKLRIGFYLDDDYVTSVPAIRRAVHMSVEALQNQGYEVIPWKFPDLGRKAGYLWGKVIFSDSGDELLRLLKHDALDHSFNVPHMAMRMNRTLFSLINFIVKLVFPRIGRLMRNILGMKSVTEWRGVVKEVEKFREEVERDLKERNIEVLLCPAFAMPALLIGAHRQCQGAVAYTALMNVLNFPVGTIPVTKVTAEDTAKMADYPRNDPWDWTIKKSMVGSEGLPVGVQVAALPWQEETCLRIMKELETALSK